MTDFFVEPKPFISDWHFVEPKTFISDWQHDFALRQAEPSFDQEDLDERRKYYGDEISLSQYQAIVSLINLHGVMLPQFMNEREYEVVIMNTIGSQYEGASYQEVEKALDDFLSASEIVYDEVIENALDGISL